MKVNHTQTRNKIFSIAELLKAQANYVKNHRQEQRKITLDEKLSQSYKANRLEDLRTAYTAKHIETKEKIVALLDEIAPIEREQENVFELDVAEFGNTLAAINATEGKLPPEVITGIKLNFAGQFQALLCIKAAFDRYNIDLKPYGYEEYTTKAEFTLRSLVAAVSDIEQEESGAIIGLHDFFKKLVRFGEVRGIMFDDDFKSFGSDVDEEISDTIARKAMGL